MSLRITMANLLHNMMTAIMLLAITANLLHNTMTAIKLLAMTVSTVHMMTASP
ncbi:hypothetical protein GGH97_003926, partial [Coemansia sp. RSA 475]